MSEREILFRGKIIELCKYQGQWLEGFFGSDNGKTFITIQNENGLNGYFCDSKTVGQYTGLKDKNGTRIFEGDIIDVAYNPNYGGVAKERIGVRKVGFADGCYMYEDNEGYFLFTESDEVTVIGNIHDNPELLKGE